MWIILTPQVIQRSPSFVSEWHWKKILLSNKEQVRLSCCHVRRFYKCCSHSAMRTPPFLFYSFSLSFLTFPSFFTLWFYLVLLYLLHFNFIFFFFLFITLISILPLASFSFIVLDFSCISFSRLSPFSLVSKMISHMAYSMGMILDSLYIINWGELRVLVCMHVRVRVWVNRERDREIEIVCVYMCECKFNNILYILKKVYIIYFLFYVHTPLVVICIGIFSPFSCLILLWLITHLSSVYQLANILLLQSQFI